MDDLFQPKSRPYLTYFNLGLEKSYEYRKTRNKKQLRVKEVKKI